MLMIVSLFRAQAEESLPLAGTWHFSRDDDKVGISKKWYEAELRTVGGGPTNISLPGTTDEAKAGIPNPAKPNLDGLYRPNIYTGPAWYQRDVDIPETWRGKHITLFLERNHWTVHVWLDGKDIGTQDSLISPQVYDLGSNTTPGKHRLTVCVDNTLKYSLGSFVSINYEGTQTNWNGIIGAIQLRATDPVAIKDIQIYPNILNKTARVQVRVSNYTNATAVGLLKINATEKASGRTGAAQEVPFSASSGESVTSVDLPMGDSVKLWDEFSPNLYDLHVQLTAAAFRDDRVVSFGMRQLSIKGTQFTMNGRPVFMRGTLECGIFPLTGYPPTDVPSWDRIYKIMQSYGLNMIRFHSWCPPEAAFTAADRDGIMVQAEAPQTSVDAGDDVGRDTFIKAELKRMVDTYGNHPSFCLVTLGNECNGKVEVMNSWLDMLLKEDSRHLYAPSSGGKANLGNEQWDEGSDGLGNQEGRGVRGPDTAHDSSWAIPHLTKPLLGHEIGQWTFYPNFNEILKYTDVLQAKNFDLIRDNLKAKGMENEAVSFFQATGQHARLLYKEEIEVLLRTPNYSGFSLLDLHDYPGQGTALIGLLDPFWASKGFISPKEHKRYFGSTVPLLRLPKRVYTTDETLSARLDVAHFGSVDLPDAQPDWTITDNKGQVIAKGSLPSVPLVTGKLSEIGKLSAPLNTAAPPAKLTVTVSLKNTDFSNSWDIWVYPPSAPPSVPSNVIVSHDWDDATRTALAQGKRVVLFPNILNPTRSMKGSFLPVFWSPIWSPSVPATMGILCDPKHPLFAQFPTEFYSDWQWWNLIQGSKTMILNDTPPGYRPLVQVIDNFLRNDKLGNVFEAKVGEGRLLVCSLNLRDKKSPEANQFLKSLYAYVGSDTFHPSTELPSSFLDQLMTYTSQMQKLGAKVIGFDSQDNNNPAANAIDGSPDTFWHTQWSPEATPLPHFLTIDLGKTVSIKGVTYLPRPDMGTGRVRDCELYVSDDPANWGPPVATAKLEDTDKLQTISLPSVRAGRYLKFMAKSTIKGEPYIAAAEFDILN